MLEVQISVLSTWRRLKKKKKDLGTSNYKTVLLNGHEEGQARFQGARLPAAGSLSLPGGHFDAVQFTAYRCLGGHFN